MFHLFHNPDSAVFLLTLGVLLIYVEANRPGRVVPGCMGLLLVLLACDVLGRFQLSSSALACLPLVLALVLTGIVARARLSIPASLCAAVGLTFVLIHLVLPSPNAPAGVHLLTAMLAAGILSGVSVWLGRVALLARRSKRILRPALGATPNPVSHAPLNAGPAPMADPAE